MAKEKIAELRKELEKTCQETNTRLSGMEFLVNYYIKDLGWSEEKALQYAIDLFQNGTITQIKLIGKDGEEL